MGELLISATDWQADQLASWRDRMLKAIEDLQKRLSGQFLNALKEQPLKRYLHFHQRYLIHLSDRLTDLRSQSAGLSSTIANVINEVLEGIEKVLDNAKEHFGEGFDLSASVSLYHKERSAQIRYSFSIPNCDQRTYGLLEAVANTLNELTEPNTQRKPTYYEMLFAHKISSIIAQLLTMTAIDSRLLFDRLYMENFNAPAFALWYQQDVLESISGLDGAARKQFLNQEINRLLLTGIPPRQGFHEDRLSINEELTRWVVKVATLDTGAVQQLPLDLSVTQIGLFIRLCQQTGCFHEQSISGLLRFFVRHFTSKKQTHISQKSLAKAFYNADQTTAATCRAWLQRMIDQINKRYFP
ncbi:hypothetical protein INP83_06835 [Mucilaginibacter sp. 21P]|uniref:hypothetical protein n=1 Tax=Mucilaginibacter sp. 21P TaxID=2778902 RepID=UPI001C55ECA6|nr:hypothetical protein [Mucilaginibacter sp. 21P]QXV66795.1 hypothetical protein INP83_06835 [Mucilaginibacter sp. 21P]